MVIDYLMTLQLGDADQEFHVLSLLIKQMLLG